MSIAFTAPHSQASEAGMAILRQGGTAIEAMVAAAATIATVYPHMNSIGGDGFWVISEPGKLPRALDACGTAAQAADLNAYAQEGGIPNRGGRSCITMAGAIDGWRQALQLSASWKPALPLSALLEAAIDAARRGVRVTQSLVNACTKVAPEFQDFSAYQSIYGPDGGIPAVNQTLTNAALADTFDHLARAGLKDFYHGDIGFSLSRQLADTGSLIRRSDFERYEAQWVEPLSVRFSQGTLFNFPAPTQGIASMLILALYDRVRRKGMSEAEQVHLLVECTKQAFIQRDRLVTDRSRLSQDYHELLQEATLEQLASNINPNQALPWPRPSAAGDTIWMGALDQQGRMVSYIQSIYWEFGSGVVLPETGVHWNNRGISFSLDPQHHNALQPGCRPFHTLNPAYAELDDGRRMAYGTMGGEGQPQTQAALFNRYVFERLGLADAIALPRWLLGRSWGQQNHDLKLEQSLADKVADALQAKGHQLQIVADQTELMGHAGAVVYHSDSGSVEAASDPRSDGAALIQ
ncbi:gamma-glutamyltransferase family protein [Gynuella sunshinyii]|uniref:Gamma-glutamyltransferase n=1 Tax=Gynuella sunshinyii YC6258 TaxID=1445510 RepID=A0A0C5V1L0_9GAMM|nr:gamma-glutamyltransferase [Gynuella sunshinyii]AJQ93430.1 gamma-glutamyltransferase [Gynuella sunshinyii YC6258]